jgi:anti-anti-sigma factor
VSHALTIRAVRDGSVCVLILRGELDLCEGGALLTQAAISLDSTTERLVLDMAGVTFLDCSGARALAIAASFAPAGCPVIIRSVNPEVRRFLELLGMDLENPRIPARTRNLATNRRHWVAGKGSRRPGPDRPLETGA